MPALLTPRERLIWTLCFLGVAALLVVTHFESRDPDSALYANISARMAAVPATQWIAPPWFALWPGSGANQLFIENPAGIFVLPTALSRLGVPAVQAAYIVGVGAGLVSVLLLSMICARVAGRDAGRALLTLLQIMPVAFIFRIRGNHEYPMLACFGLCLLGLACVTRSWWWTAAVAAGMVGAVLIKGVFVLAILIAMSLWIVFDPLLSRARGRQIAAAVVGLVTAAGAVSLYDEAYRHVTGAAFWEPYWHRQMSPLTIATSVDGGGVLHHLGFYALRLLWHPAPWSLALIVIGWRRMAAGGVSAVNGATRRGLFFAVSFVVVSIALFSLPSRFAERYLFSAIYTLGAAGAIAAWRQWPRLRAFIEQLDRAVPALPAMLWTALMVLRIALGPWIPRLQDH